MLPISLKGDGFSHGQDSLVTAGFDGQCHFHTNEASEMVEEQKETPHVRAGGAKYSS